MGICFGKCTNVNINEQVILENCTEKKIVNGPVSCMYINCWTSYRHVKQLELKLNQFVMIEDEFDPEENRIIFGPCLYRIRTAYERIGQIQTCPILDQDDYIVVTNFKGEKRTIRGPCVYKPELGDTWTTSKNAIVVPLNCYIIVKDNNNSEIPVRHIRGPTKFIPEPYQTIEKDMLQCVEITETKGIHLMRSNGQVVLLDKPQFYMPEVGEKVLTSINKIILIETDFCIIKSPKGNIELKCGKNKSDAAFFLPPFYTFMEFEFGTEKKTILSTLPTFVTHKFAIRTADNVILDLDLRISYQIFDPNIFGANPINFYTHLINWCQNELLDAYAKTPLREFMKCYSAIAIQSITNSESYFKPFGISILDIQIINYTCKDSKTQDLLNEDIKTNVVKQNELKAKENDVLIKEKENEIRKRQKDLEVVMAQKDNEVELKRKELEVNIRLKELDLQMEEERKRTDLLNIKRENAVKEAEYEGRAQGHAVAEFLSSLPKEMSFDEKMAAWNTLRELEKANMMYTKVEKLNIYPPNADLRVFQLETVEQANEVKKAIEKNIPIPEILGYSVDQKIKKGV